VTYGRRPTPRHGRCLYERPDTFLGGSGSGAAAASRSQHAATWGLGTTKPPTHVARLPRRLRDVRRREAVRDDRGPISCDLGGCRVPVTCAVRRLDAIALATPVHQEAAIGPLPPGELARANVRRRSPSYVRAVFRSMCATSRPARPARGCSLLPSLDGSSPAARCRLPLVKNTGRTTGHILKCGDGTVIAKRTPPFAPRDGSPCGRPGMLAGVNLRPGEAAT
jgi:hypothetical protein